MNSSSCATSRSRRVPVPDSRIDCRACGGRDIAARSFVSEERIALYFIPLPTQRESHVVCKGCKEDWLSDVPLEELATQSPEQTEWHLHARISIVAEFLAVASVALFL